MGKYRRLAQNTLLIFVGGVGAKLITILMLPLYTRWLTVDEYGLTDLLTIYSTLLISIVSCCIPEALFVFPCRVKFQKQCEYYSSGVFFNTITIIICFFIFGLISLLTKNFNLTGSFSEYIWLIYMMLVTSIFQQQVQQFSRSTGHILIYSLTGVVYALSVLLLSVLLIKEYRVSGFVWTITLSNLIATLFCFLSSQSFKYIKIKDIKYDVIKEMLLYSIPLIPNSIMWWLVNSLNRPVMESHFGMYDLGIYAVANKLPSILTVLFSMFATSWQISVIEEFKRPDYKEFYNRIFRIVFSFLIIMLVSITLSSKFLISLLADSDFYIAWRFVPLLSLGIFMSCMSTFIGTNFTATKESKYFLYSSLFGAATSVILNFLLIPYIGIWGACISVVCSFVIIMLVRLKYSYRYVRIDNILPYIGITILSIGTIIAYINNLIIVPTVGAVFIIIFTLIFNRSELLKVIIVLKNFCNKREE